MYFCSIKCNHQCTTGNTINTNSYFNTTNLQCCNRNNNCYSSHRYDLLYSYRNITGGSTCNPGRSCFCRISSGHIGCNNNQCSRMYFCSIKCNHQCTTGNTINTNSYFNTTNLQCCNRNNNCYSSHRYDLLYSYRNITGGSTCNPGRSCFCRISSGHI